MKQLATYFYTFVSAALAIGIALAPFSEQQKQAPVHRKALSIRQALEDNFERTKDPALGYPPTERLHAAIEYARRRP